MTLPPAILRLLRYGAVGGGTFGFDLALMFLLRACGVSSALAAGLAFLVAVSLNYLISRHVVFHGTERPLGHGYALFIGMALAGALLTAVGVQALLPLGLPLLAVRLLVSLPIGLLNYTFNLYVNFAVAGHHKGAA